MSATEASAFGAETFAEGNWYHELLEDGLALSYRVRIDARARERGTARRRGGGVDAHRCCAQRALSTTRD
jgi:hypothetical protein